MRHTIPTMLTASTMLVTAMIGMPRSAQSQTVIIINGNGYAQPYYSEPYAYPGYYPAYGYAGPYYYGRPYWNPGSGICWDRGRRVVCPGSPPGN
jgi:hypothetical protein